MTGFEKYLAEALGWERPDWGREWGRLTQDSETQSVLRKLAGRGADRNFVLFVLAEYGWRRINLVPHAGKRDALVRAIDLLLNSGDSWRRVLLGAPGWDYVEQWLQEAKERLKAVAHMDSGGFSAMTTKDDREGGRWRTRHVSTGLVVLDWHMKRASGHQRTNLALLGPLVYQFQLTKTENLERWVEQRLRREWQRLRREEQQFRPQAHQGELADRARRSVERFVIFPLVLSYHEAHRHAGLPCGSACHHDRAARRTIHRAPAGGGPSGGGIVPAQA